MEVIAQLGIIGFAAALFLCLMSQIPTIRLLRWWFSACVVGMFALLLGRIAGPHPSTALGALLLLGGLAQFGCVMRGLLCLYEDRWRPIHLWRTCGVAALLVFLFLTAITGSAAQRSQALVAVSNLVIPIICGVLAVHLWKQRSGHTWATLTLSATLVAGFFRGVLDSVASLGWLPQPLGILTSFALLSSGTWAFIAPSAALLAMVYIAISVIATLDMELRTGYGHIRRLVDSTNFGICEVDEGGQFLFANRAAATMLELDNETLPDAWIQEKLCSHDDETANQAITEFALRPTAPIAPTRTRLQRADQSEVSVEWSSSPIFDDGSLAGAAITLQDVTERDAEDRFVQFSSELLEMIVRNKPVEEASRLLSAAVETRLPGFRCSVLISQAECFRVTASANLPEALRSEMASIPCNRLFQAADGKGTVELRNWEDALRSIARSYGFGGTWTEPMISAANELLGTIVLNRAVMSSLNASESRILHEAARLGALVVEHHAAFDRLLHQGYHDALTGLPNRLLLADRLKLALARSDRMHTQLAYISIDLDRFKYVNDTLGHDAGDLFLQQISIRLAARVRSSDTLARTGGDEFTLILPDIPDIRDAGRVAESLITSLRDPFQVSGHTLYGAASVGIAIYPKDGADADSLQRNADRAMYRAKAQGRNSVQYYSGEDSLEDANRIEIELHLRRAVEQGDFTLHFQPQFTCDRRLSGFEALLRFQHPKLGMVPPSRFIPMAEDSGLILPLGEWVLQEVCRQILEWNEKNLHPVRVAVNVSPLQLARGNFADTVARALRASRLKPDLLELEFTEGVLMSSVHDSARQLADIAKLGVRLAVDDFGTGYSCLSYLHQLPLQVLKIDRSFVARMLEPDGTRCIVEAIISLAHRLGLKTVAEGVENDEQLAVLQSVGCDFIQGFLFSRPLSAVDASCLLWRESMAEAPGRDVVPAPHAGDRPAVHRMRRSRT